MIDIPTLWFCPYCGSRHPEDVLVCPVETQILPLEGRLLDGKFRFDKLLGAGGMGSVWQAQNLRIKKAVAIKLMSIELAGYPRILEFFSNESRAAGEAGSQHICDIYDFGPSVLGPFIVLELLRGMTLADLCASYGRVDPGLAVILIRQALEGLDAAHRVGIIHRDLKPQNIFLHEPQPGRLIVKLLDFGVALFSTGVEPISSDRSRAPRVRRVGPGGTAPAPPSGPAAVPTEAYAVSYGATDCSRTDLGALMGTPWYMSPEHVENPLCVDPRSDIWAVGAVLYEALCGIVAFAAPTLGATFAAILAGTPRPIRSLAPHVPPELVAVVDRCLAKNPNDRYPSCRALSDALAPFEPQQLPLPPAPSFKP